MSPSFSIILLHQPLAFFLSKLTPETPLNIIFTTSGTMSQLLALAQLRDTLLRSHEDRAYFHDRTCISLESVMAFPEIHDEWWFLALR